MAILEDMTDLARRAKAASRRVARLTEVDRNRVLVAMADALLEATVELEAANALDREVGRAMGLSAAMLDRLTLDRARITAMAQGVRDVAALPDPVTRVLDERVRPNGLRLRKIAVPIGVVVIIYESRPNVTADAASLCLKTGNATLLRGGKEALHSNRLIASIMVSAARAVMADFPEDAILVVPTADREAIPALLSLTQYVDLCMPRGGEGLIRAVTACSKVPVIKHYKGVCHVYVQADADLRMAEEIVFNAKCQRPSTCNAAETLLVDRTIADRFLPQIASRLATKEVLFHADIEAIPLLRSGLGDRVSQVQDIAMRLLPRTKLWRSGFYPRSIPRQFIGMRPPDLQTEVNSEWGLRLASVQTRLGHVDRWAWKNFAPTSGKDLGPAKFEVELL